MSENENSEPAAENSTQKGLGKIKSFFELVGKPIYNIFYLLLSGMLIIPYITGHIIRIFFETIKILIPPATALVKQLFRFLVKFPPFLLRQEREHKIGKRVVVKVKKSGGIIFQASKDQINSAKKHSVKLFRINLRKAKKGLSKNYDFVWKAEVFWLAVQKLSLKTRHYFLLRIKDRTKEFRLPKPAFGFPGIKLPRLKSTKFLGITLIAFFIFGLISAALFWYLILQDLPSPYALTQRSLPVSTKIYDRNGILLYTIYKDENRTPVTLDEIPTHVRLATIAAEDAEFYSHPGFSIRGIARALIKNIRAGQLSGGSTITQQLVKNALLTPEKTIIRKLKEVVLAIKVELVFSKDDILEMYLNEAAYGGTAYGIQEAARSYFDKDVNDLTLSEAALLAGLPQSPTRYSPFGSSPEAATKRQREILNLMAINGFITSSQKEEAENQNLALSPKRTDIKAPHFVFFVRELLENKYGKQVVEKGGLEVYTTLDYRIQQLAEQVVKDEVKKLAALNVSNGAAVVLDPKSGEVLAMVGSKDYFDTTIEGNVNVVLRPRQPGSSIKVVNYANALSKGLTPATVVNDSKTTFRVEGQPPYTPSNYEGGYRGNISLRSALAESRNIPAVKVLALFGVESMFDMGKKMGITTWNNVDDYGLSLTLGGGEVKLIDLATVYATLADYGERPNIVSILKATNYEGKVLEEYSCTDNQTRLALNIQSVSAASTSALPDTNLFDNECSKEAVLDPRIAFMITDILKDNGARSPSFGDNSLLNITGHKEVAAKTGTSNDLRDNLAVGYTQDYVVAVWVGNNDNTPMARIASGVTGATPIWNKIMSALLADRQNHDWPVPSGLTQTKICSITGTLPCDGCPTKTEWFFEESKPAQSCDSDWFKEDENKGNGRGKNKKDNKNPSQRIPSTGNTIDNLLNQRFNIFDGLDR